MTWGRALFAAWGLLGGSPPNAALPDPRQTPGAVDVRVTQQNIGTTICVPGYARSVRPPYAVTRQLKRAAMISSGHYGERYSAYEFDHLVPLSLGGAQTDARNLWLEPVTGQWGAADKDDLEYFLWIKVCRSEVSLSAAQAAIAGDWIAAHRRSVRGKPQARWPRNE